MAILFVLALLVLADASGKYFNWASCNLLIRDFSTVLGISSLAPFAAAPPFVPLAKPGSKCYQHSQRFLWDLKNLELWAIKSKYVVW